VLAIPSSNKRWTAFRWSSSARVSMWSRKVGRK